MGDETCFMGYTTFKPFGLLGGIRFPVYVCFARCYRRFGSILFYMRVKTLFLITMSSVFLVLSLDDSAQLLHFYLHPFLHTVSFWHDAGMWKGTTFFIFSLIYIFTRSKRWKMGKGK